MVLVIAQQHLHIVVAPLHKNRVRPAPVQKIGSQVQKARGIGEQLVQFLRRVGEDVVGVKSDLTAGFGTDIAVEGVQHRAGILFHFNGGNLQQLMERDTFPLVVAVKRGIPLQVQKNQLGHIKRSSTIIISLGRGAAKVSGFPVTGCVSSRRTACRAGRAIRSGFSVP